jgi:hypothetical protein
VVPVSITVIFHNHRSSCLYSPSPQPAELSPSVEMAQVLVRDHAYGPDAGVQKAPTVTVSPIKVNSSELTWAAKQHPALVSWHHWPTFIACLYTSFQYTTNTFLPHRSRITQLLVDGLSPWHSPDQPSERDFRPPRIFITESRRKLERYTTT